MGKKVPSLFVACFNCEKPRPSVPTVLMDDWYIAVDASAGLASTLCENTLGGHEKITTTYTLALLGIVLNAALLHTIHLLAGI